MREPSDRHSGGGEWRNWASDEGCRPREIARPESIEQIAEAVGRATRAGRRVRAVGAGHSFSDIACSDEMLLSLERCGQVLEWIATPGKCAYEAGSRSRR
jgi:L-gulonolactone oxidase